MSNRGERDENLIKAYLVYLRDNTCTFLPYIGDVRSVKFDSEYNKWPKDVSLQDLKNYSKDQIDKLVKDLNIEKADSSAKSDVYINNIGISLKSLTGAPPALINHTHRKGFLKVAERINQDISLLDKLVQEYWELREAGKIKEDVSSVDENSPFRTEEAKKIIKPYLSYFLFQGTAKSESKHTAQYLVDVKDVFDQLTWTIYDKESAISDQIYNRLVFSVRSKAMPKNYPNISKPDKEAIEVWTRFHDDKYKGALHVRFRSSR